MKKIIYTKYIMSVDFIIIIIIQMRTICVFVLFNKIQIYALVKT